MSSTPYVSESWATLWEALADAQPDQIAVVLGDQEIRWKDLDDRAARLATVFSASGVKEGSRVAQLLYNDAAYLESVYALFKLRATPVNVNLPVVASMVMPVELMVRESLLLLRISTMEKDLVPVPSVALIAVAKVVSIPTVVA